MTQNYWSNRRQKKGGSLLMIASHGETHRDGGSMNLRKNTAIESKDCRRILKITKGNALFKGPHLINEIPLSFWIDESSGRNRWARPAKNNCEDGASLERRRKSSSARQYSPVYWLALAFSWQAATKWLKTPQYRQSLFVIWRWRSADEIRIPPSCCELGSWSSVTMPCKVHHQQ